MEQPFGDNGFPNFKDIFNSLLYRGKDAIDNALTQYPQPLLTDMVEDLYQRLQDQPQSASFGGGLPGGAFDEEKLTHLIDSAKEQMKKPLVSLIIAKQIKRTLATKSNDDIATMLEDMAKDRSLNDQMMISMAFMQLSPMLDQIRAASDEDVAAQVRDMADEIPSRLLAQQLIQMAAQKAAANNAQNQNVTENLPTPEAVADTFHKLGHAASDALDAAAKSNDVGAAAGILKQFSENARSIIANGFKGKGPDSPGRRFNI